MIPKLVIENSIITTLLLFSFLTCYVKASAEIEKEDSITVYNLDEITIEAPKVIRKADMDLYIPSETSIELSTNGLQLLTCLQIPSLFIDEINGNITAAGQEVQIRSNGRIASVEQIRNLNPETIKRVEWIDNPGLKYDGASYVINFIILNQSSGGSFYLSAQPMLNTNFGNYMGNLKLNKGRSQWEINAYYKNCTISKVHRDYNETFTFPNGSEINRTETPLGGKIKNDQASSSISYNFIKPDTTIFYASFYNWSEPRNLAKFNGRLDYDYISDNILLTNEKTSKGNTPSLTLYLEQHFKRNQILVLDFSGSFYIGKTSTLYLEKNSEEDIILNDISTDIKDFNQVYSLEANYIKNWSESQLSAGFNYTLNRNRSKYLNLYNMVFHQYQDKLYFFSEYLHRIKNFTLRIGIGAQYTSFRFKETLEGNTSWNIRPQATLTYSPNYRNQFRINFTSWQNTPSLSQTNIVPQQIDGFQWDLGNPYLKTFNTYKLDFRYSFNYWRIGADFNISTTSSPKSISPYLYWDSNKLITSYENSLGKQSISFSIAPQIEVIPEWLSLSGRIEYLNERTKGTGYKLYNHNWNGSFLGILSHWNFSLMIQYYKAGRYLDGEKISWGEDVSAIALTYQLKNWQFGVFMFMPFGKYDQGSKMISKWNKNENHIRLDFRMVGILINYNLQWGRQKQSVNKLIENEINVEKSSAKSR